MIKENTEKRKTVRGSVLFTTVSVMALLIIFLSGALALASSANNRAHKSYSSSQASYNARAAIDSFMQAMQSDAGVAAAVHDMDANGLQPALGIADGNVSNPDVWDKDNNPSSRWGTIGYYDDGGTFHAGQIDIHKTTNQDQYEWDASADEGRGKWVNLTEYKITATARYGREEETVNAYMRTLLNTTPSSSGDVKGLQSVSGVDTANNGYITGGYGLNLKGDRLDPYSYTDKFTLDTELAFLNASVTLVAGTRYYAKILENGLPSKMVVTGDLNYTSSNGFIIVDYDPSLLSSDFTQEDIPYVFVEGRYTSGNSVNKVVDNNRKLPFNFFAGSMNVAQGAFEGADIYLMDSGADNYIGSNTSTSLYKWANEMTAPDVRFNSNGGNIYCNGNLTLSNATFDNDVRVQGDCYIYGNTKINGNLIVGGTLTTSNRDLRNVVTGNVYANVIVDTAGNPISADMGSIKENYVVYENTLHENELLPGYTVTTIPNVEIPVVEDVVKQYGEYGWYYAAKGNGTNPRIFDWGELNNYNQAYPGFSSGSYTVYWLPDYSEIYFKKPYYAVDKNGFQTGDVVEKPESKFYTRDLDNAEVSADEALGSFYTEWNDPGVQATEQFYYYYQDPTTGALTKVDATEACNDGKINHIGRYTGEIYPANMTKEKIYGSVVNGEFEPADDSTKLIPNIREQRAALGLDEATGEVTSSIVDLDYELQNSGLWDSANNKIKDDATVYDLSDNSIYTGGVLTITDSCVLTGDTGTAYTRTINIAPGANDIYILCDDVSLGKNSKIIVYNTESADSTGKIYGPNVSFIVKGAFKIYNAGSVINSTFLNGGTTDVKYTDRYGMYFYGFKDSSIELSNGTTIVGVLRMPYTNLVANVEGGYTINYTGEDGTTQRMKPVIIGSAIVNTVQCQNNFQIAYTIGNKATGGGGGGSAFFSATRDKYQVLYYSAS